MIDENELPQEIQRWIETCAGRRLIRAERRPGGGRREAWFVDVEASGDAPSELFLRLDRGGPERRGDPYTTLREAEVYRALEGSEVPVPRTLGVHREPQAVLSERVAGETWFSRIRDPDEQLDVARDFIRILAALHRIDPAKLDIPSFPRAENAGAHLFQELDTWQSIYEGAAAPPDPLIDFAFDWLRRNAPDYDGPIVLVQGDTGPGNFLYADRRVTAVLDWELSHWGDPMDDLAWTSLRATQEPFTHFPDRIDEYAALSGHPLDLDRIRYYRVFAELRIVVMGHGRGRPARGEIGNGIIYGALHHRLLVESLVDVLGLERLDTRLPARPATDREWLYDAALDQIRDVIVPRSADPFVILRVKGLARILKHLRDSDRWADAAAVEDLDDLASLLGVRPRDAETGRAALCARLRKGDLEDAEVVRYFQRNTSRRTELARSASGALADRHYPPLR